MTEWKNVELGEVVTLKRGYDLPQQKRVAGTVPIFSSSGINGYHNTAMVKGPGVVTGRYGTIGQVFFAKEDFWPLNTTLYVEDFHGNDPEFIYYFLKTLDWNSFTSASAVPGINRNTVHKMPVTVPELLTQRKIASILKGLDDKIELNNKINENLFLQAQALFKQRFIFDNIDGNERPLYDFCDYINGAAFKPSECGNHGLPIVKIAELKNGITDSTKYFDGFKGDKYIIQNKDILFSWSGNPDTSIDVFIWTHGKAILNQHTFNVKSKTGHRWFAFMMLKYFKPEFSRIASNKQTTGLGHVTASDLKRLTFIFNESATEKFENEVTPFMETIYSNMIENQKLVQLRNNLLSRLMSGEISLTNI